MTASSLRWVRRGALALGVLLVLGFAIGSLGGDLGGRAADLAPVPLRGVEAEKAFRQTSAAGTANFTEDRAGVGGSAGVTAPARTTTPPFGDRIVRTADLTVEVRKGRFVDAWNAAHEVARRFGGQVLTASTGTGGGPVPILEDSRVRRDGRFGDITIRVPTGRFEAALKSLRGLGEVRGDMIGSEDVTQEFVDLRSRLRNLRAQQEVLLRLMRRARTIGETLDVQQRLQEVQGQIEEITGRIRFLEARTDFATINLHLAEPGAILLADEDEPSFSRAWETALIGLRRMGTAAMILGLWLLPFAVIALVVLGALRLRRPAPQA